MEWTFATHGVEGSCDLFGVKIFDHKWESTDESVVVKDPLYDQDHTFPVYKVRIGRQDYVFAAGEFSNLIWGFYLPKE